jgi:hypothetical protein
MADGKPEGLMTETSVRNTVKQLLKDLRHAQDDIERERAASVGSKSQRDEPAAPEPALTQAVIEPTAAPRERTTERSTPAIGQQRTAGETDVNEEEMEAALA